jgi:hypothetical protein
MIAKIRELNVDDLKTVSGGVGQMAVSKVPMPTANAQILQQASVSVPAPNRPTHAQLVASANQLLARY